MAEKVVIGNAELWLGDCREVLPLLSRAACAACGGSGVGGYFDHGATSFGEDAIEQLRCDSCDGIGNVARAVDVVVTDPPYGVALAGKSNKWRPSKHGGYESFDDSEESILGEVIPAFVAAVTAVGRAVVTPGARMCHSYPKPDAIGGIYNRCGAGSGRWGFECVAPVYYYGKDPYLAAGLGRRPNGWEQPVNDYAEKSDHPCPKPIGMMRWLVERASLFGETVLDPFMGSGTTGVACSELGRNFIGIERERKYFDIACERIERAQAQGQLIPHEAPEQVQEVLL